MRNMAVQFIVHGLVHDYHVCEENEIQVDLLYCNMNYFLRLEKLLIPRRGSSNGCPFYIKY